MLKQYVKMRLSDKFLLIFSILLIGYLLIGFADENSIFRIVFDNHPSFLNANINNLFFSFSFYFFMGPFFLLFLRSSYSFFSRPTVMVRFTRFSRCWRTQILSLLAESAAFVVVLNLLLLIRAAWFHHLGEYAQDLASVLQYLVLQTLGFFGIALLFTLAAAVFRNPTVGFGLLVALFIIDDLAYSFTDFNTYAISFILIEPGNVTAFLPKVIFSVLIDVFAAGLFGFLFDSRDHLERMR